MIVYLCVFSSYSWRVSLSAAVLVDMRRRTRPVWGRVPPGTRPLMSPASTINVAAGSFTVTTGMTTSGKGLTITGAGAGSTNITDNGSAGYAFNFSKLSAANFTTISGFTFIRGATHAGGM